MATRSTKRAAKATPHVRFYRWELESLAFRSLSPVARCVLLELKAFYNGMNNDSLFLSAREAGRRVGVGRTKAWEALRELQQKGFIRPAKRGAFSWKTGSRRGDATCWHLTEYPAGDGMGVGSKDFMRWKPDADLRKPETRSAVTDAQSVGPDTPTAGADALVQ